MQVYDLDKTQQWLDRTLAIRRDPPVRGGVRADHRSRRQTALGVGVLGLALLALLLHAWLRPQKDAVTVPQVEVEAVKSEPAAVVAALPDNAAALSLVLSQKKISGSARYTFRSAGKVLTHRPVWNRSTEHRTLTSVAPPAPVWLDGSR